MRGFLADIYLRPSCYRCKCKNGVSRSDLTIADYWGIEGLMPDFDDDKGVGLVLVNTDKGREVFNTLDMDVRKSDLDEAWPSNGGFKEEMNPHPKRENFFSLMQAGISVEWAVSSVLQAPMHRRVASKVKRLLLKLVK